MTQETLYYILDLVKNRLMKNWCNWHKQPILLEERLVVTIRLRIENYITNGFPFQLLDIIISLLEWYFRQGHY
ncbi:hypothetical protein evm_008290 [Chilo suppressalis]|nr:hypothetical protein evm_008290 [Chilo suppressalis]